VHARRSYRSTRNVGKLLGEASKSGATTAIILGAELADGLVQVKDLVGGEQRTEPLEGLVDRLAGGGS
jgi:histidyl-tRNA synthetase